MFDSFLKKFRNIYIKPTTSNGQNEGPSATVEFLMPIQEEIKEAPAKKESTKEPATVTLSVEEALEMLKPQNYGTRRPYQRRIVPIFPRYSTDYTEILPSSPNSIYTPRIRYIGENPIYHPDYRDFIRNYRGSNLTPRIRYTR